MQTNGRCIIQNQKEPERGRDATRAHSFISKFQLMRQEPTEPEAAFRHSDLKNGQKGLLVQ